MARPWQVVNDYFSRSNKRQTNSCKVWTTNSIRWMWYLVHYKPEFFLVNNSPHIVSECPRASGNGSLLGHIELTRRTIKRKSHFDQIFSKKKKRASLWLSARRQHRTGTGNECHEWFSQLCKRERNALANIFIKIRGNRSKIL